MRKVGVHLELLMSKMFQWVRKMRTKEQALEIISNFKARIPPHNLRVWVGGQTEEVFEAAAKNVALDLFNVVEPLNILNSKNKTVLDFGCGCGRTFRYFHALYPKPKYHGVDPDLPGITWCQENLSDEGNFLRSSIRPPLEFPDNTFDFIYATSVFTHFPEDLQFLWLAELNRVTKSGGYLILTTHGENIINNITAIPENAREHFLSYGFWYRDMMNNQIGSDYLDTVWHTQKYVKEKWGQYFEIVDHIDKGINGHQDLVLCRKNNTK